MNYSNYNFATSSDSIFGIPIVLTGAEYVSLTSVEKQDPSKWYYVVDEQSTKAIIDTGGERFNCKHCGAVNQIGVCEYCGSVKE